MNISNKKPTVSRYFRELKLFKDSPFIVVDVGCSGGVDPGWEVFEEDCVIYGIDPQRLEIERLRKKKSKNRCFYDSLWIGEQNSENFKENPYYSPFGPWNRSSAAAASNLGAEIPLQSNSVGKSHSDKHQCLDKYVSDRDLDRVDLIKIDCDGGDLSALKSGIAVFDDLRVKGIIIEVNWCGSTDEKSNSFHNIDYLLKSYAYQPFSIEVNRFSRSALPRPFIHDIAAQTKGGPVVQGDVLYMLDMGSPYIDDVIHYAIAPLDLLKSICIYELYELQDCAAEVLLANRDELSEFIDVDYALDLLVKQVHPRFSSYMDFMKVWSQRPAFLFPKGPITQIKRLIRKSRKILRHINECGMD